MINSSQTKHRVNIHKLWFHDMNTLFLCLLSIISVSQKLVKIELWKKYAEQKFNIKSLCKISISWNKQFVKYSISFILFNNPVCKIKARLEFSIKFLIQNIICIKNTTSTLNYKYQIKALDMATMYFIYSWYWALNST